ncbi:hypothetical protein SCHPADRAFT_35864 [Schizopora paradoxa]|uniref:Urease accessory protein UreF n=1 Tax=Schizopora paradoxa TaxID=27342 RepID=A0A0H2SER8_9AGAM|nr:hypothetical protein SCHPADRAFT_35864 [Schizopora paradoxa]
MDDQTESYLMLLLADGNLPTGSFVASSGLESYIKHGFFGSSSSSSPQPVASASALVNQQVVDFIQDSLNSFAHSALPFVSDAHKVMEELSASIVDGIDEDTRASRRDTALQRLKSLDDLYHVMTLNDPLRRASKSQGVALLTLYSKGFSKPRLARPEQQLRDEDEHIHKFVETFKTQIRREETHGHLPVCWGILTAALGLGLERSQYLNLFLQARSLLSAAIRLNTVGPYAAQQILLHSVKDIVDNCMSCKNIKTGLRWENPESEVQDVAESEECVASTWPLGEILAARHDLQHSRIFNS